jgi:hypothetical protein
MRSSLRLVALALVATALVVVAPLTASAGSGAGGLDPSFALKSGLVWGPPRITPLPDGKAYVAGSFTTYDGVARNGLMRINGDGSLDTTFDPDVTGLYGTSSSTNVPYVAVVPDGLPDAGDVYVAGTLQGQPYLVRLNPDGSRDTSLSTPTLSFFGGGPIAVVPAGLPDAGDVYVTGINASNTYDWIECYSGGGGTFMLRFNPDGTRDNGFACVRVSGASGSVDAMAVVPAGLPDAGDLYLAGNYGFVNGGGYGSLVRVNADGSIDNGFIPAGGGFNGTGVNRMQLVTAGPDAGDLYVTGSATTFNGDPIAGLPFRMNPDGTVDSTFVVASEIIGQTYYIGLVPPGLVNEHKLLVAGNFTAINGTAVPGWAMLTPDGTQETEFAPGIVKNNSQNQLPGAFSFVPKGYEYEGMIYIGGIFNTYNGTSRPYGARIYGQTPPMTVEGVSPAFGPPAGNTSITIAGTGFNAGATVTVGGAGCTSVSVVSETSITCRTPAGVAGTADVVVTNTDATTATGTGVFSYATVPGAPGRPSVTMTQGRATIAVTSPVTGTAPTSYTVTATPGGATCTVTPPATSCTLTGLDPAITYVFAVTATNAAGTSSSSTPSLAVTPGPVGSVPTQFGDVTPPDGEEALAIQALADLGITTGAGGNPAVFDPTAKVNRAQMAAFLWRMAGEPNVSGTCGIQDQNAIPTWARQAVCWLKANEITTNNPYNPNGTVPRGHMAAFLWRYAGSPTASSSCGFSDEAQIPTYARQASCWLKVNAITVADPYKPGDDVTRGQMALFLYRTGVAIGQWLSGSPPPVNN